MDALAVAAPGYPGVGPKRSLIESLLTAEHGPGGSTFLHYGVHMTDITL